MESLIQSIRLVVRSVGRTPGFVVTAVLTLGLGIGLAVAVFTVAEALLLRKLPFRDQDRLVVLWGEPTDRSFDNWPLGLADARDFAQRTRSLERVAFFAYEGAWPQPIRDGERMSRLRQALVSGDFFDVIGAQPLLGRALRAEDDVVGAAPVVVRAGLPARCRSEQGTRRTRITLMTRSVLLLRGSPRLPRDPRPSRFWLEFEAATPTDTNS